MANRDIYLHKFFSHEGFCAALRKTLRITPSPFALYSDVEPLEDDEIWHVTPHSEEDLLSSPEYFINDPDFRRMLVARNPDEVKALRQRLEADPMSWRRPFSAPLPGFRALRMPQHHITHEYLDAISRLKDWAEAPIYLGDADPELETRAHPFSQQAFYLIPLAKEMLGRISDTGLALAEMVDSTLIYTAKIPKSRESKYQWCVRVTIQIEREQDIWITNIELVDRIDEPIHKLSRCLPYDLQRARWQWGMILHDVTRRTMITRLLRVLNIHDEEDDPIAYIFDIERLIKRADERAVKRSGMAYRMNSTEI